MALSDIDRDLLERCISRKNRAWEDFVDRFLGLFVHVINHVGRSKSQRVSPEDRDDLCAQVLLEVVKDDFAVLRHFRRQSSLATYLSVVARRVVVREMLRRRPEATASGSSASGSSAAGSHEHNHVNGSSTPPEPVARAADNAAVERISDRDEVQRLLAELNDQEQVVVRMYHLEEKSYREISASTNIPENSVGSLLSRSREKMRMASERDAAAADSN